MQDVKRGFKRKTIIEAIENKLSEWYATLPEELVAELRLNVIVTGGAIPSMLLGDLPNDYDVYLVDKDVCEKLVNHYLKKYVKSEKVSEIETRHNSTGGVQIYVKSSGVLTDRENQNDYRYFESLPPEEAEKFFKNREYAKSSDKPKYTPQMITSNAISLDGDIQIVTRFCGTPADIHTNFDFLHATSWYCNGELEFKHLDLVLARELRYQGSKYPICALFRLKKFLRRGWTITAGEILKIAWDINKLDLTDIAVLQDQLTGVDAAYFNQVLAELRAEEKDLDRTYLFELVNRVFN
jgi:hypothetical protein